MKPFVMLMLGQLLPLFSYAFMGLPLPEVPPAQPDRDLNVAIYTTYEDPLRLYVRFDNPGKQPVSVSLLNERNDRLFATSTRQPKYNLRLKLDDLANGSYSVRVVSPAKTVVRTLRLSTLEEQPRRVVSLEEPAYASVRTYAF